MGTQEGTCNNKGRQWAVLGTLALATLVAGGIQLAHRWPLIALLRRTIHHDRIWVPYGEPIDPRSILVSIGKGICFWDGKDIETLVEKGNIPRLQPDQDPSTKPTILIEVPPDSKIDQLGPLFPRILEWGHENLVFLVQAPEGLCGLPLPLPTDTCCFGLTVRGKKHSYANRADRIYVEAESGPDGTCIVKKIQTEWDRNTRFLPFKESDESTQGEDERPQGEGNIPQAPRPVPPHPPLGAWNLEDLWRYLSQPEVRSREPIVELRATGDTRMSDLLQCLSALIMTVGPDLVVWIENR